ncbi:MAG: hypothetical protein HPZ91_11800 [Lentisphaeria bacterium]|nr:hypothetical protein [Lentisphaeria bacterium]
MSQPEEKKAAIKSPVGPLLMTLVLFVFAILAAYLAYLWLFCRFYVPAGHMAVVTAKSGKTPASGTILVERGEKGIWREVLAEGRHFLDPIQHDVKIVEAVTIPLGKVGIVTAKVGKELAPGEIIAPDRESKGVWRDVLGPGVYRLNPEGYSVEIVDAINIPAGYAGVVTSQSGTEAKPGEFAKPGERGVFSDILQPGLYYLNRYAYQVNVIEIGMNQVTMAAGSNESMVSTRSRLSNATDALAELEYNTLNFQKELRRERAVEQRKSAPAPAVTAKSKRPALGESPASGALPAEAQIFGVSRAVEFPSRDGFKVALDMTVEFELMPENLAKIYLMYGDLPQVVEKIILPQVLSVSRLKGSSYRAQDFIMGEGRETFQYDLSQVLGETLAGRSILVHNAIIRNVDIPINILSPIRAVSLAREQNLTNESLQGTAKKLAELNIETELIEQRRREVGQETEKLVARIAAERDQAVAQLKAETELTVAGLKLRKSEILAKIARLKGETEVKTRFLVNNESARGELLKAEALGGAAKLSELKMVDSLNPQVETRIIYAGPGTLWTDLKSGTLPIPAPSAGQ